MFKTYITRTECEGEHWGAVVHPIYFVKFTD